MGRGSDEKISEEAITAHKAKHCCLPWQFCLSYHCYKSSNAILLEATLRNKIESKSKTLEDLHDQRTGLPDLQ
jgi:hypothetical protein